MQEIFDKLAKSEFRSKFKLKDADINYVKQKGLDVIKAHAKDFIKKRIAPKEILNDGKQTPMRGHPVFIAQHATATCCRGCIEKWHHFSKNRELTEAEQDYLISLIMTWIKNQVTIKKQNAPDKPTRSTND